MRETKVRNEGWEQEIDGPIYCWICPCSNLPPPVPVGQSVPRDGDTQDTAETFLRSLSTRDKRRRQFHSISPQIKLGDPGDKQLQASGGVEVKLDS